MEGGPLISIMDPLESDRRIWGNLVNLRNLAEQIWGNPEDSRPTCRVTHFLVCYKFFQRWHWYSNPTPTNISSKIWTSPAPGSATGNRARQPLLQFSVDVLLRQPASEPYNEGDKLPSKSRFSYQPTFGEFRPLQFWWPYIRNFQQNVLLRFIPLYHE